MPTHADWGFLSEADEALIDSLRTAALAAVDRGQTLRLVLKDGDVKEGVPERVRIDASQAPALFNTPLDPLQREQFGPIEVVIEIGGSAVLAQEVREFAVLPS
jgi:hypothetical protein